MIPWRVIGLALVLGSAAEKSCAVDLVFNDATGIYRLDTSHGAEPTRLFETFETRGLAFDASSGRLVWTDVLPLGGPLPGGVVRSGSLAGGTITDLVTHLTNPAGVVIDDQEDRIVWSDLGSSENGSAIFASQLDGQFPKNRIQNDYLSEITGLAADEQHGKLYFSYINPLIDSIYNGAIAGADLKDLSNVETIISGLARPRGVGVDPATEQIYWADAGLSDQADDGMIMTASATGERRVIVGGLTEPYGIALDLISQDLYWTDSATGKIQRTAMSGVLPFFEDVRTGLKHPTAITLVPESSTLTLFLFGTSILWPIGRFARRQQSA